MAGFYIHIPFCRKVCYYCDFHFVASLKYKDEMLEALLLEIKNRADKWKDITFNTIYFGGGTPSVLTIDELNKLTKQVKKYYKFSPKIEFTLEANPDDLSRDYLSQLKNNTDINRLSIGTQSFHDKDLLLMNRRHSGKEAYQSIKDAQELGFENINIDLIYGTPGLTNEQWKNNISKFIELKVPHLSAYHLSFEPKTVFEHMRKKNKITPVNENISQEQYVILIKTLRENNYQHYEVSNFAFEEYFSEHNTNYWLGKPYLGIGPSAHSYINNKRRWNIANNTNYCKAMVEGDSNYYTEEQLSVTNNFNEYIITSLRTFWGVDFEYIRNTFGEIYAVHVTKTIEKFSKKQDFIKTSKGFAISEKGWFISDYIMRELVFEE